MESEIRKTRDNLLKQSKNLREMSSRIEGEKGFKIREKQDEIYKKWNFFDTLLKTEDKRKEI